MDDKLSIQIHLFFPSNCGYDIALLLFFSIFWEIETFSLK